MIYERLCMGGQDTSKDRTFLFLDQIAELLVVCLRSTYLDYKGSLYEQKESAVISSPVSAVVANLYMEFFEVVALEAAPTRWKRYISYMLMTPF